MIYLNERHRARFVLAARNVRKDNFALLSALYLLTAGGRLWSCCKHHINNGCVFFENIKLNNEKKFEFYWGYKNHVLVDCITGLPIFELTTTADVHDSSVALNILSQTDSFLPINACTFIADKA